MRKYISVLWGKNWQGRSFEHELKPLTAIVGKNRSGKTSLVNALRVGLLSYSPKHGNKPNITFGFAGAPEGASATALKLKLSDGTWNNHNWEKKSGSVKYDGPAQPIKIPPVLLDLEKEFFGKSGPQQATLVFTKMDLTALGFAVEEVTARLKADVKVEEPTKETEKALAAIIDDVNALDEERHEFGWTYPAWMEKVIESIKEKESDASDTLENMAGVAQGTAQLQAGEGIKAPFNRAELDKARKDLADLVAQRQKYQTALANFKGRARMKDNLTAALSTVPDHNEEIKVLREENAAIQRELDTWKEPAQTEVDGKVKEREWLVEQVAELKTRLELKEEEVKKLAEVLAKNRKLKCCPRCGSKGKNWNKAVAADADALAVAETERNKIKEELAERTTHRDNSEKWIAELSNKRASQRGGERLSKQNADKIRQLEEAMRSVKVKVQVGDSTIEQKMDVAVARNQLETLNEIAPEPSPEGVPTEQDEAAQREAVEKLEDAERESIRGEADKLRIAEANAKHALAKATADVCALALKVLKTIKAEMMEKAFGGFMKKVNQFTEGFFPALTFREGEIGYFAGATWVGWEFICGTEKMLASIGLAIALAEDSPVRIVVIDEWLRDSETRALVLDRLAKLVMADVIDQAIFLDTESAGLETAGFTVINV